MNQAPISVCCPVNVDPTRVARMLALLRPSVSEIVVFANTITVAQAESCFATVADQIYSYDFWPGCTLEQVLPWMFRACHSPWIFLIHCDEVPSQALIDALMEYASDRFLSHTITRRWVFSDAFHYLDEYPWHPDFVVRLVRNDPATMQFDDHVTHGGPMAIAPFRTHIDTPLYHLETLLTSQAQRASKIDELREIDSEPDLLDGRPLNRVFYDPETWSQRPPAPLPSEDVAIMRYVMDGTVRPALLGSRDDLLNLGGDAERPRTTLITVDRAEVERWSPWSQLPEGAYRAGLSLVPLAFSASRDISLFEPGERRWILVSVRNRGDTIWPYRRAGHQIFLGSRWIDDAGNVALDGEWAELRSELLPGECDLFRLLLSAPSKSGQYSLSVDLVHDGVRWFDSGLRIPVQVSATTG